ncbi:MAG: NERD domain-containing protein [Prochlorotrichaceae cyanobacterium]|jgi:hypothetical protein
MLKLQSLLLAGLGILIASLPWSYPVVLANRLPQAPPELPQWATGVCFAIAAVFLWQGYNQWQRSSKRVKKRNEGWAITEAVLQPLLRQGWVKQENLVLKGGEKIDIVLKSPKRKTYCINVQSHRGKIAGNTHQIFRVYDNSQRPFETDLLSGVRQQVSSLKKYNAITAVPVLTFPEAIVEIEQNPISGVYVTGRLDLRACLLQLDRN